MRHIDFGTVENVESRSLRPLLRRWAGLRAQAVRARLAGVRPAAGGGAWPAPACAAFLAAVIDRRLVAEVVNTDTEVISFTFPVYRFLF